MKFALPAIWAIAAISIAGSLAGTWWWASMFSTGGYFAMRDAEWGRFVSGLSSPLCTIGSLAIVAALTVHALLWRRRRLTPPAAPSP